MSSDTGRVLAVNLYTYGDELAAAAAVGATSITVRDPGDFNPDGGSLIINDQVITYLSADDETGIITLATGLSTAAAAEDRVDLWSRRLLTRTTDYIAQVALDGSDFNDDAVEATIPHALVGYLPEGIRDQDEGEAVALEYRGDELYVADILGQGPVFDRDNIDLGIDDLDAALAQLNIDLEELNEVTLPQLQSDLAAANADLATLDGKFPITSVNISNDAITAPKIAANAVSADKIVANSITGDKIVANAVSADKIAANSIGADKIVANSIGGDKIAANSIAAGHIQAGAIQADKIAAGAITAAKLAANAIDGQTITGATVQTASSGNRVTLSSIGGMVVTSSGGGTSLEINTAGQLRVYTYQAQFLAGLYASNGSSLYGGVDVYNGLTVQSGGAYVTGSLTSSGALSAAGITSSDLNGGGNTPAEIGNSGLLKRGTSSARYKHDIEDLDLDPATVLSMRPVTFRRKDEGHEGRRYAGFIAEELADLGLETFIYRNSEGQPEGIHYSELSAALLVTMKDLAVRLENLEADRDRDRAALGRIRAGRYRRESGRPSRVRRW